MNVLNRSVPLLVFLALFLFSESSAKDRLVIAKLNWNGSELIANVLKVIIENELNAQVQIVFAETSSIFAAMDRGDGSIDVHPDFWIPNQAGRWKHYIEKGSKETVLANKTPYVSEQGLYIPAFVQHANPDLKSVKDLSDPEIVKLFDSDGDGKGEIWFGDPEWSAYYIEKIKAKSYGYGKLYQEMETSQGKKRTRLNLDLFLQKLKEHIEKEVPILFYYWSPEWVHSEYQIVKLKEPPFGGFAMEYMKNDPEYNESGCWKMYQPNERQDWYEKSEITCGAPYEKSYVVYSKFLMERSPHIAHFLNQVTLSPEMVNSWVHQNYFNKVTPEEVAKKWVKENREIIKTWLNNQP